MKMPLDGEPWDGDPDAPLLPETTTDDNLPARRSDEPDQTDQT